MNEFKVEQFSQASGGEICALVQDGGLRLAQVSLSVDGWVAAIRLVPNTLEVPRCDDLVLTISRPYQAAARSIWEKAPATVWPVGEALIAEIKATCACTV